MRAVAVVLDGDADDAEAGLDAETPQHVAQPVDIEVAAAHDDEPRRRAARVTGGPRPGRRHPGRRRRGHRGRLHVAHDLDPARTHAVEVVGERPGGRLAGHEAQTSGEVALHRRAAGAAAHDRTREDHGGAGRGGGRDLARDHLGARRDDQAHSVLERFAGQGQKDVGGAEADVDGEDPGFTRRAARPGVASRHAGPPARARAGGLKRSFQTFVIASRTMSLVIFDSPTLRSTKMMGSSTTRKPSWWTRYVISIWKP